MAKPLCKDQPRGRPRKNHEAFHGQGTFGEYMTERKAIGTLTVTEEAGFPVISVTGYFEEELYGKLEIHVEKFLSEGKVSLIIDFSKCIALNSLAIGQFLFLTMKVVEDFQGNLFLTHLTPVMVRVFELADITPSAKIALTVKDAVSQLTANH